MPISKFKILLAIFILTFIVYGNSITNKYALDDAYVTVTNPDQPNNSKIEKGLKGISEIFTSYYIKSNIQNYEYRPLVLTTFAVEYHFFGSNPHISHFINVLLYAITCILLFLILSKLLKNYTVIFPTLITLLFLLHPIHTEVVSNIKSRDELLSFLCGMFCLFFILKNIETKKLHFIFMAMLFLFMGFLCKKTALLFMAFIPITLYFFTEIKLKKSLLFIPVLVLPFIGINLIEIFVLKNTSSSIREFAFFENPLYYEHSLFNRIPTAFYTPFYYLKLFVFPYPLCSYYGYSVISLQNWTSLLFIISALFHLYIIFYAAKNFKQKKIQAYFIVVYLIGIFPFSNLFIIAPGIVGERFVYFASLAYCIALSFFLLKLFKLDLRSTLPLQIKNIKSSFKVTLIIIFSFYACLTISRNNKWKNELTLLKHDVKNFENSCNLNYMIGNLLYQQVLVMPNDPKKDLLIKETTRYYTQALKLMEKGIKNYPSDFATLNNMGFINLNILNDPLTANFYFKKALFLKPKNEVTQYNLALSFEKSNLKDSAIFYYEKVIAATSNNLQAYIQLQQLYISNANYLKAISCNKKAVAIAPKNAMLRINLGNNYMLIKDTLKAINEFEMAIKIEPHNIQLKNQITNFVKSAGYSQKAKTLELIN